MRIALLIFDYLDYHLEFQGYGVSFADTYGDGEGQGEEGCAIGDGWGEGDGGCQGDGYSEGRGLGRYVIKFQTMKGGN